MARLGAGRLQIAGGRPTGGDCPLLLLLLGSGPTLPAIGGVRGGGAPRKLHVFRCLQC